MTLLRICSFAFILFSIGCGHRNPNVNNQGTDQLKSIELNAKIDPNAMNYQI